MACLSLALVALVSGCGSPRNTNDAAPQRFIEAPTIADNARQKYGDRAEQAYRELAQFSLDEWLKPALVDPGAPTPPPETLSEGIVQRLDPTTVPHWQNSVTAALQGNADEASSVRMLRFFSLQAPTLRVPDAGKSPITGEGITEGTVGLGEVRTDGIFPLVVSFKQRGRLDLVSGRSPSTVNLRKQITLTVVPLEELAKVAPAAVASPIALTTGTGMPPWPSNAPTLPAPPSTAAASPNSTVPPPAPSLVTRGADVKWLITTFQGDISTDDKGVDSGTSTSGSSTSAPPGPSTTPSPATPTTSTTSTTAVLAR